MIARAAGRPVNYEDTYWHNAFLDALRIKPNITAACKVARIARRTAYYHRERYEEFAADWDDAMEEGRDLIEDDMHTAAREGNVRAQEFLLTKWRYGMHITGKNTKKDEPAVITVEWGE
jgi:hypothetical protein